MNINEINQKINSLKIDLESTDYMIIKCYEATLLDEEMPYDYENLIEKRKAWRDEINNLEFQAAMLEVQKIQGPDINLESNE